MKSKQEYNVTVGKDASCIKPLVGSWTASPKVNIHAQRFGSARCELIAQANGHEVSKFLVFFIENENNLPFTYQQ